MIENSLGYEGMKMVEAATFSEVVLCHPCVVLLTRFFSV
jgi:hypothetical protein